MRYIQGWQCRYLIILLVMSPKNLMAVLSFFACLQPAAAGQLQVRCSAEYGASTVRIKLLPTADVFTFQSARLGDRFRFNAQYLQSLEDRAKLKTYVYELRDNAAVLIHASEHKLPVQSCVQAAHDFGLNKVYAAGLEREMFFQCVAVCE